MLEYCFELGVVVNGTEKQIRTKNNYEQFR